MITKKQVAVIALVFILLGMLIGYVWGYTQGVSDSIDYGIQLAKNFMEFNSTHIKEALIKYKANILAEFG